MLSTPYPLIPLVSVIIIGFFTNFYLTNYYLSQTTIIPVDATTTSNRYQIQDWPTYQNQQYNFSLKYPHLTFPYIKEVPNVGAYMASQEGAGEEKGTPLSLSSKDFWFDVSVFPVVDVDSVDSYFNLPNQKDLYFSYPKIPRSLDGTNGYLFIRNTPSGPQSVVSLEWIGMKDGYIYRLTYSAYDVNQLDQDLFSQILSTFRFSLPSPTFKPSTTWTTYSNPNLKFEVSLPSYYTITNETINDTTKSVSFGQTNFTVFDIRLISPDIAIDQDYQLQASVNNYPAKVYTASEYVSYAIPRSDYIYILAFHGDSLIHQLENQILSTFKLIE